MSETIYDSLQVSEMAPEIVSVGTLLGSFEIDNCGNTNDDEDDIFQCGKCKKQFYSLGSFMVHKRTHHIDKVSGSHKVLAESVVSDGSSETDLQFHPIILSESDILSFSIGQSGLNLTSADQELQGFEENDGLMLPHSEDIQLKDKDITNSFELRSTQIILTTQTISSTENPLELSEGPLEKLILPVTSPETDLTYSMTQPIDFLERTPLIVEEIQADDKQNLENKEGVVDVINLANEDSQLIQLRAQNKETKLKCQVCLKQFTKNFDLQQHLRSHTGERPFQCVVCGRSFTQKSNVKKHMVTHKVWPKKAKTLPDNPILKVQSEEAEGMVITEDLFVCQYCPATFNNFTKLKNHQATHASNKIFKCVQRNCNSMFESLDQFLEHTAAHQTDIDTHYTCSHCRLMFCNLDELGRHQSLRGNCMRKRLSMLYCKLCKNRFSTVEALEKHMIQDPHSYPCPECKKVYICERHLRRHLLCHTSLANHACPDCGKLFKTAQNMNVHRIIHSSEKPFICKLCPAAFARQDRLMRHNMIHDTSSRFKCPFSKNLGCKKEFYRKDKLKEHILTHSLNQNLKCGRCSRVFKRTSKLKQHESVCLSEDHPCKDCGHVSTSLIEHKKDILSKTKEGKHVNRRKLRLLQSSNSEKQDDDVSTIQVVVVPLGTSFSQGPQES